jgi:hypothetical protein
MTRTLAHVFLPFLWDGLTVLGMTVEGRPRFMPNRRSAGSATIHPLDVSCASDPLQSANPVSLPLPVALQSFSNSDG